MWLIATYCQRRVSDNWIVDTTWFDTLEKNHEWWFTKNWVSPGGRHPVSKPSAKSRNRLSMKLGQKFRETNSPKSQRGSLQVGIFFDTYFLNLLCESGNSKQKIIFWKSNFPKGPPFGFYTMKIGKNRNTWDIAKFFDKKIESCLELPETQSKLKI